SPSPLFVPGALPRTRYPTQSRFAARCSPPSVHYRRSTNALSAPAPANVSPPPPRPVSKCLSLRTKHTDYHQPPAPQSQRLAPTINGQTPRRRPVPLRPPLATLMNPGAPLFGVRCSVFGVRCYPHL